MRTLLIAIACLLSLVAVTACDSDNPQAFLKATPTSTYVGITMNQYEQELALWRSQGILEYEAKVEYIGYQDIMGDWTLHVSTVMSGGQVLDYVREPGLSPPVGGLGLGSYLTTPITEEDRAIVKDELREITIEGQFEQMSEWIKREGREGTPYNIPITFDVARGNPTYIESDNDPRHGSEYSSWTLLSLKILSQATPTPTAP